MGYAFISYSSTDHEFVTRLAEALRQAKCTVWLDRWNITGREPYWDEIQAGIEGCSHFIFVISPDSISVTSGARRELYHAGGLKSPPTIIPVMARETPFDKLPILISPGQFQIHDFVHQPFDTALRQSLNAIQAPETDTVGRRAALKHMTSALPVVQTTQPVAPSEVPPTRRQPATGRIIFAIAILAVLITIGLVLVNANRFPSSVANASTERATETETATSTPMATGTPTTAATEAVIATAPAEIAALPGPTRTPDISLVYDQTQLVVLNISSRPLNIMTLDFVQNGSTSRALGTSQWHQPSAVYSPDAMPPSACFQIARSNQVLPPPLKACQPRTWTQVGPARWFWIAQDGTASTFDVRLGSQTIQTCQIKDGQCSFALP